jgi:hypothetical protein
MDEEDGRLGPLLGHIIGNGAYSAKYGTRQQDGFQDPGRLQILLMDVTGDRARQIGRIDVLRDALMMSLRHSLQKLQWVLPFSKLRPGSDLCTLKTQLKNEVMP